MLQDSCTVLGVILIILLLVIEVKVIVHGTFLVASKGNKTHNICYIYKFTYIIIIIYNCMQNSMRNTCIIIYFYM